MKDVTEPEENRRTSEPESSFAPGTRPQLHPRASSSSRPVSETSDVEIMDVANIPSVPVNDDFADASLSIASPLNGERNNVDGRSFFAPKVETPAPQEECFGTENSDLVASNEDEEVDAASDTVPRYIPEGEHGRAWRMWNIPPCEPQNPDESTFLQDAPFPTTANNVPAAQEEEPMDWEYAHDQIDEENSAPLDNINELAQSVLSNYLFLYTTGQQPDVPFYDINLHFYGTIDITDYYHAQIHVSTTETHILVRSDWFLINPADQIMHRASDIIRFPIRIQQDSVHYFIVGNTIWFRGQFL
uniref:Uncharacterized protein n=1 Tax=Panagrolaimus sp. ES5 TaxID=591445 RepID=A0AC34FF72_9BILA